ncbi:nicotinamide/nicotinic acid mononucleotide adenylyltransferase 3 isoform X2 [Onthophagus taurus]|uniref:nicotinamide/nicotinic acid mononucleotide adenylyltransferase 3 isoform X2 n=1 Tax=Onthophagus taurus TaxID=166361 RepID=UPI000C20E424|nr:nicotinamide/nicotinic acid mononucleotide adenylyltransferase 3 isoform X2 [Onthophagus taurus]
MAPNKVVLIACGSFNPPTHMHLRLFEIARDYLQKMGICEVLFGIISPVHDAYGKKDLAQASHRLAMAKLASESSDWIRVSDWECKQMGHSRTYLVLKHHQDLINNMINNKLNDNVNEEEVGFIPNFVLNNLHGNIQVKLICGGDLLESFGIPGLWSDADIEDIVKTHGLVVISRENSNPHKFIYNSDILTRYMRNIHIVTEWITNDISSTKIRRALGRNDSVKYLVPDKVIEYITKNELYNSEKSKYLLPSIAQDGNFLIPSPMDISTESPSPINLNCINLCNSNLFSNRQEVLKKPGLAVKIITDNTGEHVVVHDNGNEEVYLDRTACLL